MLWKVTLLFCCALYCANGKFLPKNYPPNGKQLDEEKDETFLKFLQDFPEEVETVKDDAQKSPSNEHVLGEDEEKSLDEWNTDDNVEELNEPNLKTGYFPSRKEIDENPIEKKSQKKVQAHRLPPELTNFLSQIPHGEVDPLPSRLFNHDIEHPKNTNNAEEAFEIVKNSEIDTALDEELQIIKSDQQSNDAGESKKQNQFQQMFQQFSKIVPDFKQNQMFGPKILKFTQSQNAEAKVGLGQFGFNFAKLKVASLTEYMKKAITNAQVQLKKLGPSIPANNPPLVINEIRGTPIIFTLKAVEGASSIAPFGESKGIYYNKMYAFTQYKFKTLKYHYDVQIKPFGLFTLNNKVIIELIEPPAKMQISIEKEKKINLLHFEFVNPRVNVNFGGNMLVNWGLNYVINNFHPVIKNKVTEIVARDSKLMLDDFVKKAN